MFSLGFPRLLFFMIAAPNRHEHNFNGSGMPVPVYYMVGLVSFGAMTALISSGARIATERTDGWTGQLRITPLTTTAYFRAKVLTGYTMATLTLALLYASGASLGVSLPAGRWLQMPGLILLALVPFAALGILLGHLLTADSIGPTLTKEETPWTRTQRRTGPLDRAGCSTPPIRAQNSAFHISMAWLPSVKGRFDRLDGWLETEQDGQRRLQLVIDAASLSTGNRKRDEHLRSADFFDAEHHPEPVIFRSTTVSDPGDGRLHVEGELEAADRRVELTLEPTLRQSGDRLELDATTTVDQRQLGMTWSPLGITRTPTTLTVHAELRREQ